MASVMFRSAWRRAKDGLRNVMDFASAGNFPNHRTNTGYQAEPVTEKNEDKDARENQKVRWTRFGR